MKKIGIPFANELKDVQAYSAEESLQLEIDRACQEWKELDEKYLTIPTTLLKTQTKSRLAIPRGFSFNLTPESDFSNYHNDKLPENVKVEYYQKLTKIVRSIPKVSVLENNLNECSLKLKEYFEDNKKITNDLANFPELEINYPYQRISTGINQIPSSPPISPEEKVYTIAVFNIEDNTLEQQFQVLGSQSLRIVADTIECVQKHLNYDLANNSESSSKPKQSFLFIQDNLYLQDLSLYHSNPSNITPLLSWLEAHKKYGLRNPNTNSRKRKRSSVQVQDQNRSLETSIMLTIANDTLESMDDAVHSMDEFTINQLPFQIGESYLYNHCDICEHLWRVVDIHSFQPLIDAPNLEVYPRSLFTLALRRRRRCQICDVLSANYILCDDRFMEDNPCFSCKKCFEMMHYDEHGTLLYDDFFIFPYLNDT